MAKFSEKLRPEEEAGGFEPGDEKDETFLLERLPKYPGELDRYVPENREAEPISHAVQTDENVSAPIIPDAVIPLASAGKENAADIIQEKRGKKSALPWLAAAILVLALFGAGGWWIFKNSQITSGSAVKKDSMYVTTENGVAPEIIIDTANIAIAGGDSLKTDLLKSDTLKSNFGQNIAEAVPVEKKAAEVLKEMPKVNPDTLPQRLIEETRPKEPVLKRSETGLYVVQVYSSPSRDDAEEWIGKLRERNAGNAIVTSQKIRGQEWYRVRFGSYSTRSEAESAALKFGFAQSWIVQVR
ncbi:MAG: SPOR domain-containing protein [Bacteroidota bacterium]